MITSEGAKKIAAKKLAEDPDYFKKLGSKGGKISRGGGFTGNSKRAREMGKRGGTATWNRHGKIG